MRSEIGVGIIGCGSVARWKYVKTWQRCQASLFGPSMVAGLRSSSSNTVLRAPQSVEIWRNFGP